MTRAVLQHFYSALCSDQGPFQSVWRLNHSKQPLEHRLLHRVLLDIFLFCHNTPFVFAPRSPHANDKLLLSVGFVSFPTANKVGEPYWCMSPDELKDRLILADLIDAKFPHHPLIVLPDQ
jgi:hypothetical protein